MADGNLQDRIAEQPVDKPALDIADIAAELSAGAEKVTASIKGHFENVKTSVIEKVSKEIEKQTRINKETNAVDVETTDKILNGAMNNSRFDIKVNLAEGILNGLFCGSGVSFISIHIHQSPQTPAVPSGEAGKPEDV